MASDLKIAIVEDEPLIADHIEQYVLDAGFKVLA
jgi:DNA-binding response OmpR family regulator